MNLDKLIGKQGKSAYTFEIACDFEGEIVDFINSDAHKNQI